jgi:hypothetical protein
MEKNLYTVSVKLSYLFQFLAHTPYKLEFDMVHGHIQTPKNQAVCLLVQSTSSFLLKWTLHPALSLRILSNHMLP